jgi:small conductance mechanosensitive channel
MLLIVRPFRIGHKVQIGGNIGTVTALSLFWTELVGDDKVQIIVPNGGVWGQALRNYSVYPAPPHAGEVRFRIPEGTELDRAIKKVREIVEAHPRALPDPAPSVLLDHSADDSAIEIVVAFYTADDEIAIVKSDLIKAVHTAFDAMPEKRPAGRPDRSAFISP